MRPYIICHMTVSENERVTGPFLETSMGIKACDYYYQIHRALKADAFACGRVTMETSFTHGWFPDLKPFENIVVDRRDFIVKDDHAFCAVAFDTKDDWDGRIQSFVMRIPDMTRPISSKFSARIQRMPIWPIFKVLVSLIYLPERLQLIFGPL